MLLEHRGDGEGRPTRHQRRALLPHVAAVLDGLHDRGVGRGSPDAELLELGHEAGLGEAGRRLGRMALRGEVRGVEAVRGGEGREAPLLVVVAAPLLHEHPATVGDHGAGGRELGVAARRRDGTEAHRDGLSDGVVHLAGHGAPPDQLVEPRLAGLHLASHLFGAAEPIAGGADGLMGLLRVGHLLGVAASAGGNRRRPRSARSPRPVRRRPPTPRGPSSRSACR